MGQGIFQVSPAAIYLALGSYLALLFILWTALFGLVGVDLSKKADHRISLWLYLIVGWVSLVTLGELLK